jgi:hypothetical protein
MAMKDDTDGSHNKMQEMRWPCPLYGNDICAGSMLELCQIRGRSENEFQLRLNSAAFAQCTVNRLSQRLNRSDSMEERLARSSTLRGVLVLKCGMSRSDHGISLLEIDEGRNSWSIQG